MSNNANCSHNAPHCIGLAFGALLLRLWVGMRLLFAGLEKWKNKVTVVVDESTGETKTFWRYDVFADNAAEVYKTNMGRITSNMNNDSPLQLWMIEQFASTLGWMLLIVGAWVIIGLASRTALIAAGFVFLSLTFGLATIGADPEIVERGIEIGLVVGALALARYQVFGVDGLIRLAMGKSSGSGDDSGSKRDKD
jgi:uncharacterized membrane protein YphA (DoxX/SURF4 family)